jgi:hypothetical protein
MKLRQEEEEEEEKEREREKKMRIMRSIKERRDPKNEQRISTYARRQRVSAQSIDE